MKYVVSANYRDRASENKWLVRRADEHPDKAVPCKEVRLKDVRFRDSNEYEEGFGCKLVAFCEDVSVSGAAVDHDLPTGELAHPDGKQVTLKFKDYYMAMIDEDADEIAIRNLPSCELNAEGMFGYI